MVESSAAALAYGLLVVGQKTVLVFDMGGGTLDITIMGIAAGLCRTLATAGHPKVFPVVYPARPTVFSV